MTQNAHVAVCLDRIDRMALIGELLLWIALLFALAAALAQLAATLIAMFPPKAKPSGGAGAKGAAADVGPQVIVDSAVKLLEALSKAPPWLAMLAAGAGLIWLASSGTLLDCRMAPPGTTAPATGAPASGAPSPAAPPADNPGAKAG